MQSLAVVTLDEQLGCAHIARGRTTVVRAYPVGARNARVCVTPHHVGARNAHNRKDVVASNVLRKQYKFARLCILLYD